MSCFGSENGNFLPNGDVLMAQASRKQTKTAPVKLSMAGWGFGVDLWITRRGTNKKRPEKDQTSQKRGASSTLAWPSEAPLSLAWPSEAPL
jgi:hypothetical protein